MEQELEIYTHLCYFFDVCRFNSGILPLRRIFKHQMIHAAWSLAQVYGLLNGKLLFTKKITLYFSFFSVEFLGECTYLVLFKRLAVCTCFFYCRIWFFPFSFFFLQCHSTTILIFIIMTHCRPTSQKHIPFHISNIVL